MSTAAGPPARTRRGVPWWTLAAAATVLVVIVATVLVVLAFRSRDGGDGAAPAPVPSAQQPTASPTTGPTANPTGSVTTPAGPAAPSREPVVPAFRFLPLWPFGSVADAVAWQREALPGGHQPWHLDIGRTALSFTNSYLRFDNVDRILGVTTSGDQAWASVGYRTENGQDHVSAIVHLARIGRGADRERPWEVVGSRDTALALTTPRYGSTVSSPVTTGGRITGVDEALRVQVRSLGHAGVLGEVVGVPAGGENAPWSVRVAFRAAPGSVLTIVVSTGGHAGPGVERFAITGVHA